VNSDYSFDACAIVTMDTPVGLSCNGAVLGHIWVGIIAVVMKRIICTPIMQKGTCSSVIFRPRKRFSGYLDLLWRTRKKKVVLLSTRIRSNATWWHQFRLRRYQLSCCNCNHTCLCSLC